MVDLPLSAAVIPDFGAARTNKAQGWLGWVRRGDVDFVVPMALSLGTAFLVTLPLAWLLTHHTDLAETGIWIAQLVGDTKPAGVAGSFGWSRGVEGRTEHGPRRADQRASRFRRLCRYFPAA